MNLPFDNHWVDDRAAVVNRQKAPHFGLAGLAVNIDDGDIGAVWKDHIWWVVVERGLESGFVVTRIGVGGKSNFFHRDTFTRRAHDFKFVIFPF